MRLGLIEACVLTVFTVRPGAAQTVANLESYRNPIVFVRGAAQAGEGREGVDHGRGRLTSYRHLHK